MTHPSEIEHYTQQMIEVEQRIDQIRDQLHLHREKLCAAVLDHLFNEIERLCAEAWETKVREDKTGTFPQTSDAAFMRDMKQARQEAVDVAQQRLQSITYWVYLTSLPDEFYHDPGVRKKLDNTARDQIKSLLRELFGYAGGVISKYKCITGNTPQWRCQGSAHPQYDSIIPLGQTRKPLEDYEQAMGEYLQLHLNRDSLSRDRRRIEAEVRWEQAKAAC